LFNLFFFTKPSPTPLIEDGRGGPAALRIESYAPKRMRGEIGVKKKEQEKMNEQ
jgi:hypothetical protein